MNEHDLRDLASRITPDPLFIERLEKQLEESSMNTMKVRTSPVRLRWALAAAAALAVTASVFLSVPPLRTWAQEVIEQLFRPAASDERRIVYAEVDVDTLPRVYTLEEADALAEVLGVDVLIPSVLPDELVFEESVYFTEPVYISLSFASDRWRIMIYQLDAANEAESSDWSAVGASAEVQDVPLTLHDATTVTAQYVQGAWVWYPNPNDPTPYPGQEVDEIMTWDPNVPMRRLRWQAGDIIYEVAAQLLNGGTVVDPLPPVETLIAIAEGLR